jgi:hypothetical protein
MNTTTILSRSPAIYTIVIAVCSLFFNSTVSAQSATDRTPKIKVEIHRQSNLPPRLLLETKFEEPSGNKILDAEEDAVIKMLITNDGDGMAYSIKPTISFNNEYIIMSEIPTIRSLGPKKQVEINAYLHSSKNLTDGKTTFAITISEYNGFSPQPVNLQILTQRQQFPNLVLGEQAIDDVNQNRKIDKEEMVHLTLRIQNTGGGNAKDVTAELEAGANTFLTEESRGVKALGFIEGGGSRDVKYTFYTNSKAENASLTLRVYDATRLHGFTKKLDLPFNNIVKTTAELSIPGSPLAKLGAAAALSVDIEENIPQTDKLNPHAVALIIAIQDYQNPTIPSVKFAKRDAAVMREYLVKVLGYDPKNILPQNEDELMTCGTIKSYIKRRLASYLKPNSASDLFIYYVGHGAPNTQNKTGYLVPLDCDPNFVGEDNAYNMREFQNDIMNLKAKSKTIVVDACFSGQAGDGRMLLNNASPIYITVDNQLMADSTTSILLSSEADQVSNWYPEKQHSMFTYFFLKGLKGDADKNKDHSISLGELEDFVNDASDGLPYFSNREHQRVQRAVIIGRRDYPVR